jgi:hypothetical protein
MEVVYILLAVLRVVVDQALAVILAVLEAIPMAQLVQIVGVVGMLVLVWACRVQSLALLVD